MALNLLLTRRPPGRKTVIFADPAGDSVEPLLAGLFSELGAVRRVMFPSRDDTLPPDRSPPALVRRRYADLWHALSAEERARVLVVAGPTAAYLAPVIGSDAATTLVAVGDPKEAPAPEWGAWPCVLGPFPELDEVPQVAGSKQERERWLDRIRTATSELELVRASDLAGITKQVAAAVGLGPQRAARAGTAAASFGANGFSRGDEPPHWLDELLYSLSKSLKQQPEKRGPRSTKTDASSPADDSPAKAQRSRKRRATSAKAKPRKAKASPRKAKAKPRKTNASHRSGDEQRKAKRRKAKRRKRRSD